jgi:hypothetical protein
MKLRVDLCAVVYNPDYRHWIYAACGEVIDVWPGHDTANSGELGPTAYLGAAEVRTFLPSDAQPTPPTKKDWSGHLAI